MRITRLIAGTLTAGLLGITPIAISAPASAAVTVDTAATITSSKSTYVYGETINFDAAVTTSDPERAYAPGEATLYMLAAGSSAWEAVATDDGVSYLYFSGIKARGNAAYKVVYAGGTDLYDGDVFNPSESAPITVNVARKVVLKSTSNRLFGKIAPKYKRKPIKVQKKVGKKWKKYKTFKTNKKGKFSFKLPAPRRGKTFWKITVPGNKQFATWQTTGSTYSYRGVAPRASITN